MRKGREREQGRRGEEVGGKWIGDGEEGGVVNMEGEGEMKEGRWSREVVKGRERVQYGGGGRERVVESRGQG